jgi:hypothetical protein
MPYFVYKISAPLRLNHIETKERYKEARALVRRLRQGQPAEESHQYRIVFANNQAEAAKLLSRPPDERVIGED